MAPISSAVRNPAAADLRPAGVGWNRADGGLGLPDDQARFASADPGSVLLAAHPCGYMLDYLQAGMMVMRRGRGRGRGRGAQRDALRRNDRGDIMGGTDDGAE
jgi:hypothetical protein